MKTNENIYADADGFLTGSAINSDALLSEWEAIENRLSSIERGVFAIEKAIKADSVRSRSQSVNSQASVAEPALRADRGRAHGRIIGNTASPSTQTAQKDVAQNRLTSVSHGTSERKTSKTERTYSVRPSFEKVSVARNASAPGKRRDRDEVVRKKTAIPDINRKKRKAPKSSDTIKPENALRDAKGRFVGGGDKPSAVGISRRSVDELAGKIANSAKGVADTVGDADPAVIAVKEIAEPISSAFSFLSGFSNRNTEESLLKKILKSIGGFRKDQSTFNKAEKKALSEIAENTEENGGRAEKSGLRLPFVGKLPTLAPALALFAKRIPVIGGILSAIGGLFGVLDSETDSTLSRGEKDKRTGKAVGTAGGGIGGMMLGAKIGAAVGSLGGPIGTAIGGVIGTAVGGFLGTKGGEILGETVGGWIAELREADIPGKITAAWAKTTESIQKTWDSVLSGLTDFWNGAKNAVSNWIKETTGVDIGAVSDSVEKAVSETVDRVKSLWPFGEKKEKETGVLRSTEKTDDTWKLGETSTRFESGGRGVGTISTGKGDAGGASYGEYQLSSKAGTLDAYLKASGYSKHFEGLTAGSAEFNEKWKELAKTDANFGASQHDFIQKTHYDKAIQGLSDSGIDLSKRGKAVQDAVWSTSVQFGAGSSKSRRGAVPMFKQALAGRDVSSMSDEEIVTAVQDFKLANNDKLFASSSKNVRMGTARRAMAEKEKLIALAREGNPISHSLEGQKTLEKAGIAPKKSTPIIGSGLLSDDEKKGIATAERMGRAVTVNEAVRLSDSAVPSGAAVRSLSVPSVKTPTANRVSPTSPMSIPTPIGTSKDRKPMVVTIEKDAGQDVEDRALAHIVTGGLK